MFDIDSSETVGIFRTDELSGCIPIKQGEFDIIKIYFVSDKVQQCECYNTQTKKLKVYRRTMINSKEFSVWHEVKSWYECCELIK